MVVITKARLTEFGTRHAHAIDALNDWWDKAKASNWTNAQDVRNTFNSVDSVGNDRYVFNIRQNRYRIVAMIHFNIRTVYIRFVGTHREYDDIDCKTI